VQQRLALAPSAAQVPRLAVLLDLPYVPAHSFPTRDLPAVLLRHATTHVIAAIPLEPATRVVRMDPPLGAPDGQGLAGIDAEEVQRTIAAFRRKLRSGEPACGKLVATVGQVFAAEHTEHQHLLRSQLRSEVRIESAADRGNTVVTIASLHPVVHNNDAHHATLPSHPVTPPVLTRRQVRGPGRSAASGRRTTR
jgi:hypothetical protein